MKKQTCGGKLRILRDEVGMFTAEVTKTTMTSLVGYFTH